VTFKEVSDVQNTKLTADIAYKSFCRVSPIGKDGKFRTTQRFFVS